ncbi:MAG TPA: diguanylate cyclase [Gemmatimonadales bacterium]|nr:diguanylate cyclase [Gemmatimonadales bacterium]
MTCKIGAACGARTGAGPHATGPGPGLERARVVPERPGGHYRKVRRSSGLFSRAVLLDLWETRAGRVLAAMGLGSVRTTIITLAVLATLIPALATSVTFYRQSRKAIRAKLDEQLSGASSQAARETGLWLKERLYDLRVFASSYEVSENIENATPQTRRRLSDYLGSVNDRFADYVELMVVGTDLRTLASSAHQPGSLHLAGNWLQLVRSGDPALGNPVLGDASTPTTMEIAVPIQSTAGQLLGVLAGRLNFHGIEQRLRQQVEGHEERVAVVQPGGQVIALAGGLFAGLPDDAMRQLQRAGAAGAAGAAVSYRSEDGVDVVGALSAVPSSDWSAVAEIPGSSAFKDIRRLRDATVLMVVVLLVVVGSLAYTLGLLIVNPLDRLTLAANRVAGGDLDVMVPASGGGELSHLTGVFNDMVRRLREGRADLERLSVTDELTGLANRRRLMVEIDREVRRSDRHGHPFSVLMLDVDRFKRFNDSYGHPAGDAVLKRLSGTLQECVRDVDTVARYGGEEFTVILPETPAAEAARVAERIRGSTEKDRFTPEGGRAELNVTVSIGYAVFPDNARTPDSLIEAADQALYRSKQSGRNRVSAAERVAARSGTAG